MVMSWIWTGLLGLSLLCGLWTGRGSALAGAAMEGARAGVTLGISMAGSLCLWSGAARLMEQVGIMQMLSRLLRPLLGWLFPSTRTDSVLAGALSGNFCANLLGLGNAATPLGIQAAKRLKRGQEATDELCRLIVLNTASIQLIPTSVAAVRSALGCQTPFDILPAVWVTSLLSAGMGLAAAALFGRVLRK